MWIFGLASVLLLTSTPAQRNTRAWSNQEVENRLRSSDALDVAWAAHEAAERRLVRLVPALLDVLESPPDDVDSGLALEHSLDALIRLGGELEPKHVAALYLANRLMRDELLVLIARSPRRFESTLALMLDREPGGMAFHAVASLLAEIRSRALAPKLLPRLQTRLTITVLDPMTLSGMFGTGCGGFGISGGSGVVSTWPPAFDYELDFADELGEEDLSVPHFVVARSPRSIVARRLDRSPRRIQSERAPRQHTLVTYLVHLAGLPAGSVEIPERTSASVSFESADQIRRFIEEEKRRILSAHEMLRQTLATQGLLDRARWRETELSLELVIEDERTDKSIPLGF